MLNGNIEWCAFDNTFIEGVLKDFPQLTAEGWNTPSQNDPTYEEERNKLRNNKQAFLDTLNYLSNNSLPSYTSVFNPSTKKWRTVKTDALNSSSDLIKDQIESTEEVYNGTVIMAALVHNFIVRPNKKSPSNPLIKSPVDKTGNIYSPEVHEEFKALSGRYWF